MRSRKREPIAVFDARWIKPTPSGIGVCARELILRLPFLRPDYRFIVICQDEKIRESLAKSLSAAGDRVRFEMLSYGPFSPWSQLLLPLLLRRWRCTLFHAPNFQIPFLAFPAGRPGRIRCLATIHDVIPLVVPDYAPSSRTAKMRETYRMCLRQAARRADVLLTVSQCSRRDLTRELALAENDLARIHVVYNGVDEAFHADGRTPIRALSDHSPRALLYVGRMDPYKNIPVLVQAFARIYKSLPFPVRLVIAGPSDERYPEAMQQARNLGIADLVEFAGALPFRQLVELYRTADLLVHPSCYEGFGLQLVEAMRSGLPVLCTDGGSAAEIAGEAARVVPLQSDADFATRLGDNIADLLLHPEILQHLQKAGLSRGSSFTWDEAARKIALFY
ncbi:MAG: glycosyltransferase family 4 protein [Kiritimatiellia bacterium]